MIKILADLTGWLNSVTQSPMLTAVFLVLAFLVIFLAGIWLRVQPQPFFLHLTIFNVLLLVYVLVTNLPQAWLTQVMAYVSTVYYSPIVYLAIMQYWLALAPQRYGRPSRDIPASQLLQRRRWWLFASLVVIGASLLIDALLFRLPSAQNDIYLWMTLASGSTILAAITIVKHFRAANLEALLFALAFLILIFASYLYHFGQANFAILTATIGNGLLAVNILLYYKRFIGLEAELRTGLYDENLALREENIIQRSILSHTREAVLQLDRDEKIIYANPPFAKLSGYSLRQLKGKRLSEVISRNFYEAATRALKGARSGREEGFEIMLHRKNMPDVALHAQALPLLDARQKLRGIHLGFFEITENVQTRENMYARIDKLEKDLNLYRSALERTENAVLLTDTNCRILFASKSFTGISGYGTSDLIGRSTNVYRLETKTERDALTALLQGKIWKGSFKNRRKDGSEFEVDVYASPLLEDSGEVEYVLWVERDASDRLNKEGALVEAQQKVEAKESDFRELEEEFLAIHAALDTGVILVRPDGACRILNPRTTAILGYSADAISLKNLPLFVRDLLKMEASYGSKMRSEAIEFVDEFLHPDGTKKLLRWHAIPISAGNERPLGVVLQVFDITEYSTHEKQLKALEKELENARRQQNLADVSSVTRLQSILNVAESVHSSMSFNDAMQMTIRAAQDFGWTNMIIYEKRSGSLWYELVSSGGFKPRHVNALHALPVKDVDQYFQSRFAVAGGFFLKTEKMDKNGTWDFLPKDLKLLSSGKWGDKDVLVLPLKIRGNDVGLFLCGAREDGKLPNDGIVQELEKLAIYAAFAIDHGQRQLIMKQKLQQNKLLMDISKIEPLDPRLDRELAQIAQQAKPILGGEVCIIISGASATGACTFSGPKNKQEVAVLNIRIIQDILAQIREKLPSSGAEYVEITVAESALLTAMNMKLPAKQKRVMLAAPLQLRRKNRGLICCVVQDGVYSNEKIEFVIELAYRTALFTENFDLFSQIEGKAHELESANTYISEFLANVTHELRTPLHTILSYVELLRQQNNATEDDRLRHLQTIRTSGNRLLYLINDLLDLSKIEAGKMEPQLTTFDPRELVDEVSREIAYLCNKSGLALKVSINRAMPPLISSDKNMLSRVLLNLARNAQKFTDEGGTVEISAAMASNDRLILQVRDTGIGIPQNDIKSIFEPFNQLDRKTSRRYEGTGLGLPISKRLVELLGGKITIQSKVGQGSTFTIELPVQAIWRKGRDKVAPPKSQEQKSAKKRNAKRDWQILVVDDDTSTKEAMRFLLENSGYQVEFVHDGPSAINTAQYLRPDLILLDIMMPGMDGYQVARTLKAQKHLSRIPLVALTARAMNEDREKARDAGFDDFLTKPFAMDDFFNMVKRHTDGRK